MQHALSNSEWDEVCVRTAEGKATYVFRRGPGKVRYEPWVVVAPSAILARLGKRGKGVYAARSFKRDDIIGRYDDIATMLALNFSTALTSALSTSGGHLYAYSLPEATLRSGRTTYSQLSSPQYLLIISIISIFLPSSLFLNISIIFIICNSATPIFLKKN